jgi:hypothetical protein
MPSFICYCAEVRVVALRGKRMSVKRRMAAAMEQAIELARALGDTQKKKAPLS